MRQGREDGFQQQIKDAGGERVKVKSVLRIGIPHLERLKVIEDKKPDLLIMATKGRSNIVDTIIGSCAQKMFRRSPIPALRGYRIILRLSAHLAHK